MLCWGANWNGQLGDGTTTDRLTPVAVSGLGSGVTTLAAGAGHTCAAAVGRLKCWGNDIQGQLGLGTAFAHLTPVAVQENAEYISLSYRSGQPGSYFTVTGWNFPASGSASITVNGYVFTETVPVNETGSFVFFFDTSSAQAGYYRVTAGVGDTTATAAFCLDVLAPIRLQEGGGQTLLLPGGVGAPLNLTYLPLVKR
jgi:hypothetical protein